ncbi:MAG: carboxyl transferase domain-containing protein [Nocardioidaceae bacterium]
MASWGSLGHVTVAEPGALLGFLGPRVYEAIYGRPFPEGVQTAENLYAHGLIDAVLPPEAIGRDRAPGAAGHDGAAQAAGRRAAPGRRTSRCQRRLGLGDARPQSPDGQACGGCCGTPRPTSSRSTAPDKARPILDCCSRWRGSAGRRASCSDKTGEVRRCLSPLGPGALREARRGMHLADELNLPLVTVIDTPGAALSVEAEEGGLAGEIARCLADMVMLQAPTLTVMMGQGTGGGALALLPADRVVAAQHGWLSPLPPEGASAIRPSHT